MAKILRLPWTKKINDWRSFLRDKWLIQQYSWYFYNKVWSSAYIFRSSKYLLYLNIFYFHSEKNTKNIIKHYLSCRCGEVSCFIMTLPCWPASNGSPVTSFHQQAALSILLFPSYFYTPLLSLMHSFFIV